MIWINWNLLLPFTLEYMIEYIGQIRKHNFITSLRCAENDNKKAYFSKLVYIGWWKNQFLLWSCCFCCSVTKLSLTLFDLMYCNPPGSSVCGTSQSRILKWVAISFSRGSSWLRDQTVSPAWQADSLPLIYYTVKNKELYLISCDQPKWKRIWKKIYESLGCTMVIKILIQLYFNKKIFFKICFSKERSILYA